MFPEDAFAFGLGGGGGAALGMEIDDTDEPRSTTFDKVLMAFSSMGST